MLPFAVGTILGAGFAPKLLLKVAPRRVAGIGGILSAIGALWIAFATAAAGELLFIAPGLLVIALGFGLSVIVLTQAAVYRIDADKAGIGSALLNAAQQIGVALGLVVLAGVAATGTSGSSGAPQQALSVGYSAALMVDASILLATAVFALLALSDKVNTPEGEEGTATPAHPGTVGTRASRS